MNRWLKRMLVSEDGISLTEMLVVIALLGMVLSTAYMAQQAITKSNEIAERQAVLTRQITYPMLQLEKIIVQNREVRAGSGPYKLICTTDKDLDGTYELNTITADATAGGRIRLTIQLLNNDGTILATQSDNYIGEDNTNFSSSTPVFIYLDKNRAAIANSDDYSSLTRSVDMTIRASYKDATLEESRTIQFRNRD